MPRSGTSWVGQILDSSPQTAYRFQPLFSWAFKNNIGPGSTKNECEDFFKRVYDSSDAFLLQTERKSRGEYPTFIQKDPRPPVLAIKMVRYHHLLPMLLEYFNDILQVVFIVRHPCGVINSWLKNPKEFFKTCIPGEEWDLAKSRNQGRPEEFWGFDGWRRAFEIYSAIKAAHPRSTYSIIYEKFVEHPLKQAKDLFSFLKLDFTSQTENFILESTQTNNEAPYAVFKTKHVKDDWKHELDPVIRDAILNRIRQMPNKIDFE